MKRIFGILILLCNCLSLYAEVPRVITWQGRLMNQSTNQPLQGTQKRDFLVKIQPSSQGSATIPTFTQTIEDVLVENGLFTLDIDLSGPIGSQLAFANPYEIEVSVGPRNTGGRLGKKALFTVPYAFQAQNTLKLNGLPPSAYVTSHSHSSLNVTSFTVDGSREARSNVDQFLIKNSLRAASDTVFKVDENGNLTSRGGMQATSFISTLGGVHFRDAGGDLLLMMDNLGDLITPTTANASLSVEESLRVTGSVIQTAGTTSVSHWKDVVVNGLLSFQTSAAITGTNIGARIGATHRIEDHINDNSSSLQSALLTMVSGGNADDLHTHVWENGEVKSLPPNVVDAQRIRDGSVQGIHFAPNAGIQDSKLAQIVTTGKVELSALPSQVVQLSDSNSFKVAFPASQTDFDALRSKEATVRSTLDDRLAGAYKLIQLQDRPVSGISRFDLSLMSSGDLEYSRPATANTSWYIRTPGTRTLTQLGGQNLRFGPNGIFGTSVVRTDSITGNDFATASIAAAALAENSIPGADLVDLSLVTEKFGLLGTQAFSANSILNSQIAEETLTNGDFAAGSITLDKIASPGVNSQDFQDRSIAASKIQSFSIDAARFSSSVLKRLSGVDFASRSVGGTRFSSEASRRIGVDRFSKAVLMQRTQPLNIRSVASSGLLTLRDNTANAHSFNGAYRVPFLELSVPQFVDGGATAAVQLTDQNGNQIVAISNSGNLELGYDADSGPGVQTVAVTMTDRLLAVMAGVADTAGACGNGDAAMVPLVTIKASTSRRSDCISTHRNHGTISPSSARDYLSAQEKCTENGYQLCSMTQYYAACRRGQLDGTQTYLSRDLASDSRVSAFQVQNANNCATVMDFEITSIDVTTAGQFACCLRP